jgi:hypothetical protein
MKFIIIQSSIQANFISKDMVNKLKPFNIKNEVLTFDADNMDEYDLTDSFSVIHIENLKDLNNICELSGHQIILGNIYNYPSIEIYDCMRE